MQRVIFQDLGLTDYKTAWQYQTELHEQLVEHKRASKPLKPGEFAQNHYFVLCEHPPVFTLGRSGDIGHLGVTEGEMEQKGIQFFEINRGGDITFHGPGQIVGYPILDLEFFFTDVHRYVRQLEEVIIRTLADFGIVGTRIKEYTGVWLDASPENAEKFPEKRDFFLKKRKICAIGVHLSRWVTLHGFAFNVDTDLGFFDLIVPCGIEDRDKTVTSIALELGTKVDMALVKSRLKQHFEAIFNCILI